MQPSYLWNFHILQNQRAFSALRVLSLTQGGVTLTSGSRGGLERKCQTPVSLLGMPQLGTRTHLKQNKSDNVNRRVDNSYAAGVTDSLHRETRWREARPWLNVVGAQPYKSLDLIIKLIIKKNRICCLWEELFNPHNRQEAYDRTNSFYIRIFRLRFKAPKQHSDLFSFSIFFSCPLSIVYF